ncbi:MAG: response regulator [Candidatus Thorarchaeota archaeon]
MTVQILIAEDSNSTRQALKAVLKLHNYDVVGEAKDGDQAVALYRDLKPDLVLMDISMPKKHGIDAIYEILEINKKAKIIAVTALYSNEKIEQIYDAGVHALVIKPFDVPTLIKTIQNVMID